MQTRSHDLKIKTNEGISWAVSFLPWADTKGTTERFIIVSRHPLPLPLHLFVIEISKAARRCEGLWDAFTHPCRVSRAFNVELAWDFLQWEQTSNVGILPVAVFFHGSPSWLRPPVYRFASGLFHPFVF